MAQTLSACTELETVAKNYKAFKVFHSSYTNLLPKADQHRFEVWRKSNIPEVIKYEILKFSL